MEMLCPECRGALVSSGDGTARCLVHGGTYKVLFQRDAPPVLNPLAVLAPGESGPISPQQAQSVGTPAADRPLTAAQILEAYQPANMRCVQHPSVPATHQCQSCGAYMCDTCDFALPSGLHLCPACATKPQTSLGPKRTKAMVWSFVWAGVATAGFVLSLGYAGLHPARTELGQQALGTIMLFVALLPALVGFGFGLGSIDRRYRNPLSLWIATSWNGLVIATFILLCIVGLSK